MNHLDRISAGLMAVALIASVGYVLILLYRKPAVAGGVILACVGVYALGTVMDYLFDWVSP